MKRLIRKAAHDTHNRDAAILYINGQFYEDVTHAAAFQQYLKDNGIKNLKSVKMRPDFEYFEEYSKENGIDIVLGHLVAKEDAVFLIYGFEDGIPVQFDSISNNLKSKFEDRYNLPVEDEMSHDEGDYNPYANDLTDIKKKTDKRVHELEVEQRSDFYKQLESLGYYYKEKDGYYTNEYINLRIDDDGYTVVDINYIGGAQEMTNVEDLFEDLQTELEMEDIEYFQSLNAIFESLNALTFKITIGNVVLQCATNRNGYNYTLKSETNLDVDTSNIDIYKDLEALLAE